MLNYSLNVFYYPITVDLYARVSPIMFSMNTISFAVMMYVIFFNGKSLKMYRYMLMLCFMSVYTMDFVLTTGHIVQFLPAIVGYFDGILGRIVDAKTLFIVLIVTITMKMLTFCFLVVYRYAMGVPGRLQNFLKNRKYLIRAYSATMLICFLPLLFAFVPLEVSCWWLVEKIHLGRESYN